MQHLLQCYSLTRLTRLLRRRLPLLLRLPDATSLLLLLPDATLLLLQRAAATTVHDDDYSYYVLLPSCATVPPLPHVRVSEASILTNKKQTLTCPLLLLRLQRLPIKN